MTNKTLKELLKGYSNLSEGQQIIPLSEVNNMANRIIELTNLLKEKISEQLDELEETIEEDSCVCGEESSLCNLYGDMYDAICEANMYKVLYLLNSGGNVTKSESCGCEIEKPKVEEKVKIRVKRTIKKP